MTDINTSKDSINLLQPELIPVKPLWSLKRVCILWFVVIVAMVGWIFLSQNQRDNAEQNYAELKREKVILNEKMATLEKKVAEHKSDHKLNDKVKLLTLVLNNKTRLYNSLTDTTKTQVAGFAQSMTELSENHHKGISLSVVQISNDELTFTGVTKAPQSVPAWLAGFENSTFLSGKRFVNFVMKENEKSEIEFTVSSIGDTNE